MGKVPALLQLALPKPFLRINYDLIFNNYHLLVVAIESNPLEPEAARTVPRAQRPDANKPSSRSQQSICMSHLVRFARGTVFSRRKNIHNSIDSFFLFNSGQFLYQVYCGGGCI